MRKLRTEAIGDPSLTIDKSVSLKYLIGEIQEVQQLSHLLEERGKQIFFDFDFEHREKSSHKIDQLLALIYVFNESIRHLKKQLERTTQELFGED